MYGTAGDARDVERSLEELVTQARSGDAEAFAELIRRHERTALAIAYSSLGDAAAAGDVAQDAFLRAWQRLAELKEPARFSAWLARIVRNLAADQTRRRGWQTLASAEHLDDLAGDAGSSAPAGATAGADPSADLDRDETRQRIDEALQSLDEVTRSAVVLRYYDGLPSKRIGELLDLSAAAVDMRLSRARSELREKLAWADPTSAGK
jgi:RNA polymerase sigma factor (sigma-70 family)